MVQPASFLQSLSSSLPSLRASRSWVAAFLSGLLVMTGGDRPFSPVHPGLAQEKTVASTITYDPLSLVSKYSYSIKDLDSVDSQRGRSIPLRLYLPQGRSSVPVILLSHGLGGSRQSLAYLATHWASRGYGVVALQHLGSDDSVWRSVAPEEQYKALAEAATLNNFLLRVQDVRAILDQLEIWSRDPQQDWTQQLDLSRIGLAGYSFGAITAQAIGGQRFFGRPLFQDDRVQAVALLSPSSPLEGTPQEAFHAVNIPWLLMTGTADVSPIGNFDVASRLGVFPALPPGNKYEVVLQDAEHSVFADVPLSTDRYPRNPNHHRATIALSTAFWDAHLQQDKMAQEWLASDAPRQILEVNDHWQWN